PCPSSRRWSRSSSPTRGSRCSPTPITHDRSGLPSAVRRHVGAVRALRRHARARRPVPRRRARALIAPAHRGRVEAPPARGGAAAVVALEASERTKSLEQLAALANAAPRSCSAVVVVGGGTLGDLGTVLAHLVRRGVPLIQVPTTLLATVDSSVGGKGAVHAR